MKIQAMLSEVQVDYPPVPHSRRMPRVTLTVVLEPDIQQLPAVISFVEGWQVSGTSDWIIDGPPANTIPNRERLARCRDAIRDKVGVYHPDD